MKRKYIGVGLMAALVFSAAPLSGTAGATLSDPDVNATAEGDVDGDASVPKKPVAHQRCVAVYDAGTGKVTLKSSGNENKTVPLELGDSVVVCLTVKADLAAKAALMLDATLEASDEGVPCKDENGRDVEGAGFILNFAADVAVERNHSAEASLSATVFAKAGTKKHSATTPPVAYNGDSDRERGLGAEADYCKVVDLNAPPPEPEPEPQA